MSRTVHFEIQASQPQALIDFYGSLFGWTFQRWGEHQYWLIDTGSGTPGIDGGLLQRPGPAPSSAIQPVNAFICTIDVAQLDATLQQASALGASVVMPTMPVEGVGMLCYLKDPDGNLFGVMQFNADFKPNKL